MGRNENIEPRGTGCSVPARIAGLLSRATRRFPSRRQDEKKACQGGFERTDTIKPEFSFDFWSDEPQDPARARAQARAHENDMNRLLCDLGRCNQVSRYAESKAGFCPNHSPDSPPVPISIER